jgi:hypothetical protein
MFNYFCIFFDSFHYLLQFGIIYSYLNLLFIIIIYYFLFFQVSLWSLLIRLPVLIEDYRNFTIFTYTFEALSRFEFHANEGLVQWRPERLDIILLRRYTYILGSSM